MNIRYKFWKIFGCLHIMKYNSMYMFPNNPVIFRTLGCKENNKLAWNILVTNHLYKRLSILIHTWRREKTNQNITNLFNNIPYLPWELFYSRYSTFYITAHPNDTEKVKNPCVPHWNSIYCTIIKKATLETTGS